MTQRHRTVAAYCLVVVVCVAASWLTARQASNATTALAHRLAAENRQAIIDRCEASNAGRRRSNVRTKVFRDFLLAAIDTRYQSAEVETNPRLRAADLEAAKKYVHDESKLIDEPIVDCTAVIRPVR